MDAIHLLAHAKVNLHLRVLGRRPDGFHELESIFASIDLVDRLRIRREEGSGLELLCHPGDPAPSGENLVLRAARSFLEFTDLPPAGLRFDLEKAIPVGGGLGGGSSDAAATLVGLNELFDRPLAPADLHEIARTLGADVPFPLVGGVAAVRGVGDRIERLPDREPLDGVLVVPPHGVATGWAFGALPRHPPECPGVRASADLDRIVERWLSGGTIGLAGLAGNDFEPLVETRYGRLGRMKVSLMSHGAAWATLSGTGSAVIGLFRDRETASSAAGLVARDLPDCRVLVVRGTRQGVSVS